MIPRRRQLRFESLEDRRVLTTYATVLDSGPMENRVDMVFLGDGFTADQIATDFVPHVDHMVDLLFNGNEHPFPRYRQFFNVHRIDVVSNESGADDPDNGTSVDTALDARVRCGGRTTICINNGVAYQFLQDSPFADAEIRMLPVNSTVFGGSADSFFAKYTSANDNGDRVAIHELGHVFGDLADEYDGSGTYQGSEPSAANVTLSSEGTKWAQWLGYEDPVLGTIGAYEGALGYDSGVYRPSVTSKMRSFGRTFDAIAREQIILDIYENVRPIDSATAVHSAVVGSDPSLWVDVIDPAVLDIEWYVDDQLVAGATSETFRLADFGFGVGEHDVRVKVIDPTDWVRIEREKLEQTLEWTVVVTNEPSLKAEIVESVSLENSGDQLNVTVRRINTSLNDPLTVSLASSDVSEAGVPATVTIPAGQDTVVATLTVQDDLLLDGAQLATVTPTADGFDSFGDGISVLDHETLTLSLELNEISERDGQTDATITRSNTDNQQPLVVTLSNSWNEFAPFQLPDSITIPANSASVSFSIVAIDDDELNGMRQVDITARASGYVDGTSQLSVTDYETLTVTIDRSSISEDDGEQAAVATITRSDQGFLPFTLNLTSSDTTEATVPDSIALPEGQKSVSFSIDAVDDNLTDGSQQVTISTTATLQADFNGVGGFGYIIFPAILTVTDSESIWLETARGSVGEHEGTDATTVTINRPHDDNAPAVQFNLTSSDSSEISVPTTVTIPAGEDSVSFSIDAVDDDLLDGVQTVQITASGGGDVTQVSLQVLDHERLSIEFANDTLSESGGTLSGTLRRHNTDIDAALTVNLTTSDSSEATVPTQVTIPAGQSSTTFSITAVDDDLLDGNQPVQVGAAATGYETTSEDVTVTDWETLTLTLGLDTIAENDGDAATTLTVARSNTDVGLAVTVIFGNQDPSEASLPAQVVIPANEASVAVPIDAVDDVLFDGEQTVQLTAQSNGYQQGAVALTVTDHETWHNPIEPLDVNGDTHVSPRDALLIINELNQTGPGLFPSVLERVYFLDTHPDERLAPIDALLVINELNRRADEQNNSEGEGEFSFVASALSPSPSLSPSATVPAATSTTLNELDQSVADTNSEQSNGNNVVATMPPEQAALAHDSIFSEPSDLLEALDFWQGVIDPATIKPFPADGRGE